MRTIATMLLLVIGAGAQLTFDAKLATVPSDMTALVTTGSSQFTMVTGTGATLILTCEHYDYDKAQVSGCKILDGHNLDEVMTGVIQNMRDVNKANEEDRERLNKRLQHIIDILNGKVKR